MVVAGLVIAAFALLIGIVAVIIPFKIERLRRPCIEITAATWDVPGPVSRTFAVARIRNKPIEGLWSFLNREVAQGCVVEISFCSWESNHEQLYPTIRGRWSSHNQPIPFVPSRTWDLYRNLPSSNDPISPAIGTIDPGIYTGVTRDLEPNTSIGTASTSRYAGRSEVVPITGDSARNRINYSLSTYDPTLDPPQQDIGVSKDGEDVAVAILREGKAFAFSTRSYAYAEFGNPDWELKRRIYYVVVRVRGSGIDVQRAFRLKYLSNDFAEFRLEEIEST